MALLYPPVSFHFGVAFELFPQSPNDFRFQQVDGLSVTVETEDYAEGGENRFIHQLPKRTKYSDLTLTRGMFLGSGIVKWCKDAIENFEFQPTNITITLLNELHVPISAWYVVGAYPLEWTVSGFNAEESKIVVETIKLKYRYFNTLRI
ncbi:MAG: phage tail protein [Bacteroidota bacterium]